LLKEFGAVHEVDPLTDPRWPEFLARNPRASVFHTPGWLDAVQRTYGHRPAVLTTSRPTQALTNGLVFCRVQSWPKGRRLVSLPFSDHCEPLVDSVKDLELLLSAIELRARAEACKYTELRPPSFLPVIPPTWAPSHCFYQHYLDLRAGAEAVFHNFHRNCIQRKIRRAEKEGLAVTEGNDTERVQAFYTLVLQTRRRQGLPPQPIAWFRNLVQCMGDSLTIRFAEKEGQPIAAILTIRYGKSLYYKYGASLAHFHRFGSMPYLFWHAIRDAIDKGLEVLDLGRSDYDDIGLITFKDRWNASRSILRYWKSPACETEPFYSKAWVRKIAGVACRYIPNRYLAALGRIGYSYID
jgi:hypothetical protein